MKAYCIASSIVTATLLLVSPVAAEQAAFVTEQGEKLFNQYCSSCHGLQADGKGALASELKSKPSDLRTIAARREGVFPAEEIAAIIDGRSAIAAHGERAMPVWGRQFSESFGADQIGEEAARGNIAALVAYIKSIQK